MPNLQAVARTALTVLAQGLSSVTNFAAGALALSAASGDLGSFGRFAIAFQLCQVVIAIAQGSTGTAVLIHSARDEGDDAASIRAGAASAALLNGFALGAAILIAGLALGGDLRGPMMIAGLGCAGLTAQYTMRSALFARQDPAGVVRADGIWLAVMLAAASGDAFGGWDPTPSDYLAVWLIGGAISALPAILLGLGVGRRHLADFWRATGPQALRTGFDGLLARSVFVATLMSTQVIVDDEASGFLAAAVLVFSPMSVVHSSTLAVVLPTTIREKGIHVSGRALPLRVFFAIAGITVVWAALLLTVNKTSLAIGPFDLDANGVTGVLFAATLARFLALAFWRGPVVALRVADASVESLRARWVGTAAQWSFPIIGLLLADLSGGAWGLAIATWFGALVAWRQYGRLRLASGRRRPAD